MRTSLLPLLLAAACGGGDDGGPPPYREVAAVANVENRDVDMLFVIDSTNDLEEENALQGQFPALLDAITGPDGQLPNLHIGVATSDLGTLGNEDAQPGPAIGSGPGSCSGTGDAGELQTTGSMLVTGRFISDIANSDGTRTRNYTDTLANAFSSISYVGAGGCGFEQTLDSMRRALVGNAANAGFVRDSANLVIVVLTDEDDCSLRHSSLMDVTNSSLGPLQSFRCTRYGVTCDDGGTTPDEMNVVGPKGRCHSNEQSEYLVSVADEVAAVKGLKTDPYRVFAAAIAGVPEPFEVEARTPPGGGTAVPALAHTCMANGPLGISVADPGVRLAEAMSLFERHAFWGDVCAEAYESELAEVGRQVRQMIGDPCIGVPHATGADCVAFDVNSTGETEIPACSDAVTTDCFRVTADEARCTDEGHLALDVVRSGAVPSDGVVSLRCR